MAQRNFEAKKKKKKKKIKILYSKLDLNSWLKEKDNDIREKYSEAVDKAKVADNMLSSLSNVNSISNANIIINNNVEKLSSRG